MSTLRRAVLSIGSNEGDRLAFLQAAVDSLADTPQTDVLAVSPVYETDPVGGPDQPDFLNAVVVVETVLSARTLVERAHAVEDAYERVRAERWGPRTLDIDLIASAAINATADALDNYSAAKPICGGVGDPRVPKRDSQPRSAKTMMIGSASMRCAMEGVKRSGIAGYASWCSEMR